MKKIRLGIVFGGKSAEHEVSLRSARSVINALDTDKYDILLLGIDKTGRWFLNDQSTFLLNASGKTQIEGGTHQVQLLNQQEELQIIDVKSNDALDRIDVLFPILHGTNGEDGTIQGFFRLLNVPFVGVDVLASAVGMDKDVTKRLLRDRGIPIARYYCLYKNQPMEVGYDEIVKDLGLPLFVKPANAGSSVGVHKVRNEEEFHAALNDAFAYDVKLLVEEAIVGKEVEVAILGNENPIASVVGEIVPTDDFYSYEAKYVNADGAKMAIPANILPEVSDLLRVTAIKAFQCIGAEGLSRVDFFLHPDNTIVLNEINTLPGFTSISMYPKLWEATGLPYPDLIDRLIQLAIERHERQQQLKV